MSHPADGACCEPSPAPRVAPRLPDRAAADADGRHRVPQSVIAGGTFRMGDAHGDGLDGDGETPVHDVRVAPFSIDVTTVTVGDFSHFVEATGYTSEAERFGSSFVFRPYDPADVSAARSPVPSWWSEIAGASWSQPEGPGSAATDDHPVVHVSWNDAMAYCAWAGRRLPSEEEWEFAARGGIVGARYPWGDEPVRPDGSWRLNVWQGVFPSVDTAEDGWAGTAPVRTYEPNGYGLWQMVGNVWEWCSDVFDVRRYSRELSTGARRRTVGQYAPRALRGGSFLCHPSYCNRSRNAARTGNVPSTSMSNAGFRTVGSA